MTAETSSRASSPSSSSSSSHDSSSDAKGVTLVTRAVTSQEWAELGSVRHHVVCGAPRSREEICERVTNLLSVRLAALVSGRDPERPQVFRVADVDFSALEHVGVSPRARRQLKDYVSTVLDTYQEVHYHSVHHCYHVVVSANKLLDMVLDHDSSDNGSVRRTFGIRSNPLYGLALVYAALVHDADHKGVSNAQLVDEGDDAAMTYNDQSVAEQHSLSVAFRELAKPRYADLYQIMFRTTDEYKFFRKVVIELVLCTDLASPERTQIVKSKWKEAFGNHSASATVTSNGDDDDDDDGDDDSSSSSDTTTTSDDDHPDPEETHAEKKNDDEHAAEDQPRQPPLRIRLRRSQMRLSAVSMLSVDVKAILEEAADGDGDDESESECANDDHLLHDHSQTASFRDNRRLSVLSAISMDTRAILEEAAEEVDSTDDDDHDHDHDHKRQSPPPPLEENSKEDFESKDTTLPPTNTKDNEEEEEQEEEEETMNEYQNPMLSNEQTSERRSKRHSICSTDSRHNYDTDNITALSASMMDSTISSHLKMGVSRRSSLPQSYYSRSRQIKLGVRQAIDLTGCSVRSHAEGASPLSLQSYRNMVSREQPSFLLRSSRRRRPSTSFDDDPDDFKAVVVLETLLKAADVSSVMQDWSRYKLWSSRLFFELRHSHEQGRNPHDPARGWFDLQLAFLDSYVAPLARRLAETGVFGERDRGEFLKRVRDLRRRWLREGREFTEWLARKWSTMSSNTTTTVAESTGMDGRFDRRRELLAAKAASTSRLTTSRR